MSFCNPVLSSGVNFLPNHIRGHGSLNSTPHPKQGDLIKAPITSVLLFPPMPSFTGCSDDRIFVNLNSFRVCDCSLSGIMAIHLCLLVIKCPFLGEKMVLVNNVLFFNVVK